MKKRLALLVSLLTLALSLSACSNTTKSEPADEPTNVVVETPEPTSEPTSEPTAEPTAEPTSEPTAEPTSEPISDGNIVEGYEDAEAISSITHVFISDLDFEGKAAKMIELSGLKPEDTLESEDLTIEKLQTLCFIDFFDYAVEINKKVNNTDIGYNELTADLLRQLENNMEIDDYIILLGKLGNLAGSIMYFEIDNMILESDIDPSELEISDINKAYIMMQLHQLQFHNERTDVEKTPDGKFVFRLIEDVTGGNVNYINVTTDKYGNILNVKNTILERLNNSSPEIEEDNTSVNVEGYK